MESTTKTTFSDQTIAGLVQAHFGNMRAIERISALTDGWFNTAYRIDFKDADPGLVLRIAPDPDQRVLTYERQLMRKELQVYQLLAEHPELRVPRLLAADTSQRLIGRDFMFTEQLRGQPYNRLQEQLTDETKAALETQIGELMAAMHRVQGPGFGYFGDGPGAGAATWQQAFLAFTQALLADGQALQVAGIPYEQVWGLFAAHADALDTNDAPRLVHWDLWAGNIFVSQTGDTYRVEGLIDWERAFWGDPEAETAICCNFYGPAFYQGYGRELSQAPEAQIRRTLYRLYLWLIMLIEDKVRFDGAEHIPWVRVQFEKDLDWLRSR